MLRVALTGGIATGKSHCLREFAALGSPVIDADALAREALGVDTAGLAAVIARFGDGVLHPDGSLNRASLARIVFADPRARAALEAIVHPEVYRRIREWFANLPSGTRIAVADIPLLFETGQEHEFDRVIVAACAPQEQLRRMIARNALTEEDARARLAAQWPITEKVVRAHRVIWTDQGFEETSSQVRNVYEMLNAEA
jgi:dephospho-CoA kinase